MNDDNQSAELSSVNFISAFQQNKKHPFLLYFPDLQRRNSGLNSLQSPTYVKADRDSKLDMLDIC